jgi:hypothetical protein
MERNERYLEFGGETFEKAVTRENDKDNIKTNLREINCKDGNWIEMA